PRKSTADLRSSYGRGPAPSAEHDNVDPPAPGLQALCVVHRNRCAGGKFRRSKLRRTSSKVRSSVARARAVNLVDETSDAVATTSAHSRLHDERLLTIIALVRRRACCHEYRCHPYK